MNLAKPIPWRIQADVVLWEVVEEPINSKGYEAIRAMEVKGHATMKMAREGFVKERDRNHNHKVKYYMRNEIYVVIT